MERKSRRKHKENPQKSVVPNMIYICSLSAKAWCLKIIAGISGILTKNSKKHGDFWAAYVKLRRKKYFIFCESHKYKE